MPRKVINTMPEDRKEQDTVYTQKDITYSDDTDAAWIKKVRGLTTGIRDTYQLIQRMDLSWEAT